MQYNFLTVFTEQKKKKDNRGCSYSNMINELLIYCYHPKVFYSSYTKAFFKYEKKNNTQYVLTHL